MRLLGYSRERRKKVLKITVLVLVALYFIVNFTIYWSIKKFHADGSRFLNGVPEPMEISTDAGGGRNYPFMGFSFSAPFKKANIFLISYGFIEHELNSILIVIKNEDGERRFPLSITRQPDRWFKASFFDSMMYSMAGITPPSSYYDLTLLARSVTLDDLSLWSLPNNIVISTHLVLKSIESSSFDTCKTYMLRTPSMEGLLVEGYMSPVKDDREGEYTFYVNFKGGDDSYGMSFFGLRKEDRDKAMGIISSIAPFSDKQKATKEFRLLYEQELNAVIPEQLALLSLLSLEGLSVERLERLLELERVEDKNESNIEQIEKELDYLKQNPNKRQDTVFP